MIPVLHFGHVPVHKRPTSRRGFIDTVDIVQKPPNPEYKKNNKQET